MRVLRVAGIAIIGLAVSIFVVAAVARQSDGPLAVFAGGPLSSGELVSGPEPDWRFARDIETIELQLVEPPRSRTTWVVEYEGRLFVPCGYMNSGIGRLWKRWPIEAQADGRSIVRIHGKRYRRRLERVSDPALQDELARRVNEKYRVQAMGTNLAKGGLWFFELARPDDVGVTSAPPQ